MNQTHVGVVAGDFAGHASTGRLTPGEKWRSLAEDLGERVAAAGAMTSRTLDDNNWHLNELNRRFTVLQRLSQVQYLQHNEHFIYCVVQK